MRKVLTFLTASLCLTWMVSARAQQAPDMFKDVDQSHWAYQAVESLRSKGILIGYPEGYFRGKRTLTRYEFAVALDRALKALPPGTQGEKGEKGDKGDTGATGDAGPQGPPGVTPEELADFKRLAAEFRDELAALGNNVAEINRRLDAMSKDLADVKETLSRMPRWGGGVFWGVRSDIASGNYVDRNGHYGVNTGFTSPDLIHDFYLTLNANLGGGATVKGVLTSNTNTNYLGGDQAQVNPSSPANYHALYTTPGSEDTYLDQLEIHAPFTGLGRDSGLTIGRFTERISHLTLWRPNVDTYFDVPWLNDGAYRLDGARFNGNFGSVSVEAFGAQTSSVQDQFGNMFNTPIAGASTMGPGGGIEYGSGTFAGGFKPVGQPYQGQMAVDQLAGFTVGLNVHQLQGGHIRLTAFDTSSNQSTGPAFAPGSTPGTGLTGYNVGTGPDFRNVLVLGADGDLKIADRFLLTADWGKTNTGMDINKTVNAGQNNAFNVDLGFKTGALNINAGYRYVDPLFYAPGYWGRIGNWLNPTNIEGPNVRAAYDFTPSLGLNVGGDFFTGARNRSAEGGLSINDNINRLLVGLKWAVSKNFTTTLDWEGVYYDFAAGSALGNGSPVHPTEHYLTLGTGLNLTSTTAIRFGYQIGDFDGHGALFNGNTSSGPFSRYTFNTFTSQVAVKF